MTGEQGLSPVLEDSRAGTPSRLERKQADQAAWTAPPAGGLAWIIGNEELTKMSRIEHIKATITIDDVLARYGHAPLRRGAKGRAGACPICGAGKNRRSRAFTVSADGRAWYCFGDCQRGGTVIDLVMALEQCDVCCAIVALLRRG